MHAPRMSPWIRYNLGTEKLHNTTATLCYDLLPFLTRTVALSSVNKNRFVNNHFKQLYNHLNQCITANNTKPGFLLNYNVIDELVVMSTDNWTLVK